MRKFALLCLLALSALTPPVQGALLFPTNSAWNYFKGRSEASSPDTNAWRTLAFTDTNFSSGSTPIWYGDAYPGGTQLTDMLNQYTTVFLRRTFVVTNLSEIGGLRLGARCDDGFIAWINGVEVYRYNCPAGSLAHTRVAASSVTEPVPFNVFDLTNSASYLLLGTNVMAVQGFNQSISSSDFGLDLSLDSVLPDLVPPIISSVSPVPGAVSNLTQITVSFSEPVKGVGAGDLLINGFTATSMTGASNRYTFFFPQPAYGPVSITWAASHGISDFAIPVNAFDTNAPGANFNYTLIDIAPPVMALLNPPLASTVRSFTQVEVTFNEAVSGVDAADLLINGEAATNLLALSSAFYRFQFAAPPTGTVQVAWAAGHGIADQAAGPNTFAGGNWTYLFDPNAPADDVRINEFMAANQNGLRDEDNEPQDWIEIWNRGTNTVNLSGWALTDEANTPDQWVFPVVGLGPGQFLIVFASGKDRTAVGGTNRLHTNFKLAPGGEHLALYNAESPRQLMSVFAPYPEQRNDHAYGYDGTGQLRYFVTATPGSNNPASSAIVGVVEPPHFSVNSGVFNAPFQLHLSGPTPGATIRFTTNGSAPTATVGFDYTGPIALSRLTVFRAAAFATNQLPSSTETRTFLFLDSVLTQSTNPPGYPAIWGSVSADYEVDPDVVNNPAYSANFKGDLLAVPSISIVMDINDMFGPTSLHSNPGGTGLAWERPCSVELIYPDGQPGFRVDCGVRIQGGYGRTQSILKHSFRFLFKGDYGAGQLSFPLFADSPVTEFDTLVLRSGMNNSYVLSTGEAGRATFLQDEWMRIAQRDMGQLSGAGNFVHLYINGLYWGLFNTTERPSAPFAAAHLGGEKEEWDALNSSEAVDGTKAAWTTLQNLANAGVTSDAQYQAIQEYLDVTNLIDYMILNFYGGNSDWDDHNWYSARRRVPGAGYKFFMWDGERNLESPTGADKTGVNQADKPSRLYAMLRANTEFNLAFADRAHRHLFNTGALTPAAGAERQRRLTNAVYRAVVGESARWGDKLRPTQPYTRNTEWQAEVNRTFSTQFPQRTSNFVTQLRSAGLYPTTSAPVFNQHGGRVARGFNLTMSAPAGMIYVTTNGVDPRVYLAGTVAPSAFAYTGAVSLGGTMTVKARVLNGGNWSALNEATFQIASLGVPLRITEVMYNPNGGDTYEFIELQNTGGIMLDLGGYAFEGITFSFAPGTWLAPGARLVLRANLNATAWAARYPGVTAFGAYEGTLSNGGERLAIKDGNGQYIVSVDYNDADGWPAGADGAGYSLEIINPSGSPDEAANWQASATLHGTPGAANTPSVTSAVVLHEVMADNAGSVTNGLLFPDWIEMANTSASDVSLESWSLSDGPNTFVFPAGAQIRSNGFLVVWCDSDTNAPGLHTGFALGRSGETVFLHDATGARVDVVSFGLQLPDHTIGRVNGAWTLNTPTPDAPNVAASLAGATNLVLNEFLANPAPGGDDWIELFNRSSNAPVALQGLSIGTSNAVQTLTALSFIAPRGYVQLLADEGVGAEHLDFKLPAGGGSIVLYDSSAVEVNRVNYGAQPTGVTQGRLPDGQANLISFVNSASPNASNYVVTWTGPMVNEIMARNIASPVVDSTGRRADWFELFNPNPTNFPLAGMSASEGSPEAARWFFPPEASVPANGYLVVWGDGSRAASTNLETDLNLGRGLSGESGGVYLFNAGGQLVNSVSYGFQIADQTIGRATGGAWQLLASATPGATNDTNAALGSVTGLRFNEWLADPANGDDWFELFNTNARPVSLAGLWLSDDPSLPGQTNTAVRPLSFIAGHGFALFRADGNAGAGADHVNFSLDAAGEALRLYQANLTLIDALDFGAQKTGVSAGRWPDGLGAITNFPSTPTPGASNSLPVAPSITGQPGSVITNQFSTASFTVSAAGLPAVVYQWRFQGTALLLATNATLTLTDVQPADAGDYTVVLANIAGSITSAVAVLTVVPYDSDTDGLPDAWELTHGLIVGVNDANLDADGDGLTNLHEFLAGTDPQDGASVLRLTLANVDTAGATLSFAAHSNIAYTLQYRDSFTPGAWLNLTNLLPAPTNRNILLNDPVNPGDPNRFYRLTIP